MHLLLLARGRTICWSQCSTWLILDVFGALGAKAEEDEERPARAAFERALQSAKDALHISRPLEDCDGMDLTSNLDMWRVLKDCQII